MKNLSKVLQKVIACLCLLTCSVHLNAATERPVGGWHLDMEDGSSYDMIIGDETSDKYSACNSGTPCDGSIIYYNSYFEMERCYDIHVKEDGMLTIAYRNDHNEELTFTAYARLDDNGNIVLTSEDSESTGHTFMQRTFLISGSDSTGSTAVSETTEDRTENIEAEETGTSDQSDLPSPTDNRSLGEKILSWLIGLVISGLFLWMVGHIIYTLIRPARFAHPVSVDDMKARRLEAGMAEEMTEEEHEKANEYMEHATDDWTFFGNENGEDLYTPTKKAHVDHCYDCIDSALALYPTDPEIVERINAVGEYVNDRCKRKFDGSKFMLVIAGLFTALFVYLASWQAAPFFLISMAFYYIASLCPNFMLDKKAMKQPKAKTLNRILGGIFGFMASAQTIRTVTTYSDGSKETDDDNTQHYLFWIIGLILMLIMVFLLILWGAINYLRNYVLYW